MQCVLTKHCKCNAFLDSSRCLAFTSVCFMFVLWFNFIIFKNFISLLSGTDNCTIASYSSQVRCKRY